MVSSPGDGSKEHLHRASEDNLLNHDLPSRTLSESRPSKPPPLSSIRRTYGLAMLLHILLVAIHLVLVAVVAAGHLEHRVTVPLGPRANAVTVVITVVSQVFNQVSQTSRAYFSYHCHSTRLGTSQVYLVALVLLAQQLSLRKTLHRLQTLTEVHDKHTAWSGFGAAIVTVLNQRKLPTSVWGVFAIAGYLLSILVLHITVPATFSLATFNESFPGTVTLTSNIPNIKSAGYKCVVLLHLYVC